MGLYIYCQQTTPDLAISQSRACKPCWKDFTAGACTRSGVSALYTLTCPNADRRIYSWPQSCARSSTWKACRALPATPVRRGNRRRRCGGPIPLAARWMTPSIAMFLLVCRGARLKCNKASSSERPISRKKRAWMASTGPKVVAQACAIAGVRYSI